MGYVLLDPASVNFSHSIGLTLIGNPEGPEAPVNNPRIFIDCLPRFDAQKRADRKEC